MNVTYGLRRALHLNPRGRSTTFGERHRDWAQTGERVSRLAAGLRSLGAEPGDRVAVLALNSDRYLEVYLAIAWVGAVIAPVNIRWSAREIEDSLVDCDPGILLADAAFGTLAGQLAQVFPGMRLVHADDTTAPSGMEHIEALIDRSPTMPDTMRGGGDLAGIFYTGGTTGRSKGVMLSHTNVTTNALNSLSEGVWSPSMRYMHAAPMFHLANGMGMYATLLQGGSNVMTRFEPAGVLAAIAAEGVTDTLLVPTMIQMLVDQPERAQHDLSSLRRVVYGASPMSGALLARAIAMLPDAAFIQAYGMTELSPCATLLHWHEHSGEGRAKGRDKGAGRAVIGCEVRVVDLERNPVPAGTVGEVAVRGDTVMLGYWNRPEETARAVVGGWMHTGDGGVMDADGFLTVVDRIKDMIITGGENVYSVEVENAIAQHPDVAQCAVIGIPSEQWGEQVHAIVVPRPDAAPTPEEVIAFCRTLLGGFKCPRSVDIRDTPLPLSGAGKVLKRDLRAPYWEGRDRRVS